MGIILKKLKSLILFLIATFRRALCCFRRRSRSSINEDDQLTHVGVVSNHVVNDFEDWSNWNDASMENKQPQTIQEHIDHYRKKQAQIALEQQLQEADNAEDLFEDMTPRITKQTKVLINNSTNSDLSNKQNISLAPENVAYFVSLIYLQLKKQKSFNMKYLLQGNELQEWEDTAGWDDDKVDIDKALRETRKLAREKRAWEQQQKRLEKNNRPLGTRIST